MSGQKTRETDRRNPLIHCEYLPLPVRIVGTDGVTLCVNHHFTKLVSGQDGVNRPAQEYTEGPCHLLMGRSIPCPGCAVAEGRENGENHACGGVQVRVAKLPHLPGRSFRVHTQPVHLAGEEGEVAALVEVVTEITDKNQLLELFNVLSDPIYLVDAETLRFLEANDTACRQLGYAREELLTMSLPDVDSRVTPEALLGLLEKMETVNPLLWESAHCDARGVCIPVEVHVSLIYYKERKALLGISRNIEVRREEERLRAEARNREKAILDNIPFAAWMKNREGRYVAVNKTFLEQSGFAERDVLEKSDLDLWPQEVAVRFWRQTEEVLATGEPHKVEEVIHTRTGVYDVVLIRRPLLDDAGQITGVVGIAQDVSEQKRTEAAIRESEELYRTFLQRSSEAILVMDAVDWTILEANDKLLGMTGYCLEEVIQTPVQRYVMDDPEAVRTNLNRLGEGMPLAPEKKYLLHKNGRSIPVERTAALIVHRGKKMILVTLRDLSEEWRLQEQIQADVQLAGKMQRLLLPPDYNHPWLTIRTVFEPHRLVSGDYFDYRWYEKRQVLQGFVLDITGHGMGTVLQAISAAGRLSEIMSRGLALRGQVLEELDDEIARYFPEESFAAVLVFELNLIKRHLVVGTGGINRFLASSSCYNGVVELPGSFVGMGMPQEFSMMMMAVQPGDCFYFLSDGLYDRVQQALPPDLDDFAGATEWLRKLARETCRQDDSSGLFIRIDGELSGPLRFAFSSQEEWKTIRRRLRRLLATLDGEGDRMDAVLDEIVNGTLRAGGCRLTFRLRQGQRRQWIRIGLQSDHGGFGAGGSAAVTDESVGEAAETALKQMVELMDRVWYNASGTKLRMLKGV